MAVTAKYYAREIMSTIQATQGSPHNCDLLADEDVEIAFLSAAVGYDAYHKATNLRRDSL